MKRRSWFDMPEGGEFAATSETLERAERTGLVNKRTKQTLSLAALAFAVGTFPFNPVVAMYWLVMAFFLWPSTNRLATERINNRKVRDLLRRFR